ncbi:MAG: hypothetical protein QOJ65_2420 [Fimbriimonadaceae bacterium]|jgi:hypothetical protein|nr:hypothetical protein [Fimbriimonadaceae bacterium]
MRILLDECVPTPIIKLLAGHECRTAKQCGWEGIQNGALLRLAEPQFDVFITADQNMRYQQKLEQFDIGVVQLSTNNLRRIEAASELLTQAVDRAKPREVQLITIP